MKKLIITISALLNLTFMNAQPNLTKLRETKPGGSFAALTYSTPDIEKSIDFFSHMDFSVIKKNGADNIFLTDGSLLIQLIKNSAPLYELTYFCSDPQELAQKFRSNGVEVTDDHVIHAGGYTIRIQNNPEGVEEQKGKTFLTMAPTDYMDASKYPNKKCGVFGEWAIPVNDLDSSIAWWEKLGFRAPMKMMEPYPHAIMTDGYMIVGLHQTKDFSTATLTYFAPDMEPYVKTMRAGGLKAIRQTMGNTDKNVVLTSPGGQNVFLFSLGM